MPNGEHLPLLRLAGFESAERAGRPRGFQPIHRPNHRRQRERVGRQLARLAEALDARRMALQQELAGVEPELAVVFEIAGTVEELYRAVARVRGMEWLGEFEERDLVPDEDFFRTDKPERPFTGTALLVMSDRRAVEQLLSLWALYEGDEKAKFPQGLARFREVFKLLRKVRPWGPEDRLRATGLQEDWKDRLTWGSETVLAQVELWYRERAEDRRREVEALRRRLARDGGTLVGQSVEIPEIAYLACVVEVPRAVAARLTVGEEVELVRAEEVMFVRPVGQVAVPAGDRAPAATEALPLTGKLPTGEPIAALLDGLPLVGHEYLRNRLIIDDPDDWGSVVPAADRFHGTGMASLILHGESTATEGSLSRPVYVRPVLRPSLAGMEEFPQEQLYVDVLHRAVRRMFDGEGNEPGSASSIIIVNLSIGDRWRPYEGTVSPAARLLDWLAWKYGILFVVSAGNAGDSLDLDVACAHDDFPSLSADQLQKFVWECIRGQAHLRRLFAPAEAMNVLTVGAEHADSASSYQAKHRLDPFRASEGQHRLPSPVSAVGSGVGRSIKPEILTPGGRQLYVARRASSDDRVILRVARTERHPPGQQVASPGGPGAVTAVRYTVGTSNSAALVTRQLARLYEHLPTLFGEGWEEGGPSRRLLVPLLKALVVHSACWGSGQKVIRAVLGGDRNVQKARLGRYLGYGFVDWSRLAGCTPERVTMAAWDEIGSEEGHVYEIPLPKSLSARAVWRRLTITLAYLTPINPFDKRYRLAQVWFTLSEGEDGTDAIKTLLISRQEAHWQAVTRGTVQHEILEGESAAGFGEDARFIVKVNCRPHAGRLERPVPYSLLVSLEVAPGVEVPVYEEVRLRLRQRVAVQAKTV